jgi:hypothetical protein
LEELLNSTIDADSGLSISNRPSVDFVLVQFKLAIPHESEAESSFVDEIPPTYFDLKGFSITSSDLGLFVKRNNFANLLTDFKDDPTDRLGYGPDRHPIESSIVSHVCESLFVNGQIPDGSRT